MLDLLHKLLLAGAGIASLLPLGKGCGDRLVVGIGESVDDALLDWVVYRVKLLIYWLHGIAGGEQQERCDCEELCDLFHIICVSES